MKADIWCDGAARKKPNPGPAGAGWVIVLAGQQPRRRSKALGPQTNNEAEYLAVLLALREAADMRVTEVHLRTDSPVVADHYHEPHTCKAEHLKVLLQAVREQARRFSHGVTLERIRREENKEVDSLAKAARDASARRFVWPGEGELRQRVADPAKDDSNSEMHVVDQGATTTDDDLARWEKGMREWAETLETELRERQLQGIAARVDRRRAELEIEKTDGDKRL